MLFFLAISMTGMNLSKLYFMEQLRFFCENDSVEEAKTAISLTPTYKAVSMPLTFGTRQGYETPSLFFMARNNYLELAIWGIHFGDTKDPTSMHLSPD